MKNEGVVEDMLERGIKQIVECALCCWSFRLTELRRLVFVCGGLLFGGHQLPDLRDYR
jgi:hypothetical protein